MADIRINSLPTTASASSSDDFLALDGSANGTRKLNAYSPTFGGNLTVSGTGTSSFSGQVTSSVSAASTANLGNFVASNATLNGFTSYASSASLDQKYWTFQSGTAVGDGTFRLRALNDAQTNGINALTFTRSGISSIAATIGGNLTVSGTQITNTGAAESTGNIRLSHASGGKVIRWASSNYNVDLYQSGDNDILRARVANFAISSDPTFATNYTTIAAGNIVTTGNLTVSGTGESTFSGTIVPAANITKNFGKTTSAWLAVYAKYLQQNDASGYLTSNTDGSIALNSQSNQNITLTPHGTGIVSIATNLTVSGGTVTSGSGTLTLNSSANTVVLQSAGTTALTLDTSQNATFAALVKTKLAFEAYDGATADRWQLYTYTDKTFRWNYNGSGSDELSMDTSGNLIVAGSMRTGTPTGGTASAWKFGKYNTTAPSATGYVEVDIGGTLYKLLAST